MNGDGARQQPGEAPRRRKSVAAFPPGAHRQYERKAAYRRDREEVDGNDEAVPPRAGAREGEEHALDDLKSHRRD